MASMRMRSFRVAVVTLGSVLLACEESTPPASGPAAVAIFEAQPAASVASQQSLGTVRVALLDADGRLSRSDAEVTIGLASADPETQLSGSTTANAVEGIATFSDLSVARAGTGLRLVASVSGIDDKMSQPFDVIPGPAARLRIVGNGLSASVNPHCVPDAASFTVWVTDVAGNLVTAATPAVTLSLTRSGAFGITLSTDNNVYGTMAR